MPYRRKQSGQIALYPLGVGTGVTSPDIPTPAPSIPGQRVKLIVLQLRRVLVVILLTVIGDE